jgi:hypothetical protein
MIEIVYLNDHRVEQVSLPTRNERAHRTLRGVCRPAPITEGMRQAHLRSNASWWSGYEDTKKSWKAYRRAQYYR